MSDSPAGRDGESVWAPPRPTARPPARVLTALVGVASVATAAIVTLLVHDTGAVDHKGRTIEFPIPLGSVKLDSAPGKVSYLMIGYPDLKGVFDARGAKHGWQFCGQFGAMYSFHPTGPNLGLHLGATTELKTSFFTRVNFFVREDPAAGRSGACGR